MTDTASSLDAQILLLASRGVTLEVRTVAAHLQRSPEEAEQTLDDMARRGVVDLQLDEDTGALSYVPRGLDAMGPPAEGPDPVPFGGHTAPQAPPRPHGPTPVWRAPAPGAIAPQQRKHAVVGMLWALLMPGFGLFYAAPASVALLAGFLSFSVVELFEAMPFVGDWLSPVVMLACALGSALLSLVYVKRYNQVGTRAHLEDDLGDRILSRVR